jgi:hypothetical protein
MTVVKKTTVFFTGLTQAFRFRMPFFGASVILNYRELTAVDCKLILK